MSRRKKRGQAHSPGWAPANAVAWCALHGRGMNAKYMRIKHCVSRSGTCRHLRWERPAENYETEGRERL